MTRLLACAFLLASTGFAGAQTAKEAVKKVEATFEPATAKPGETVTLKIKVELAEGYHTYPVVQPSEEARFSANKLTFPTDGPLVFVGETVDPVSPKSKTITDTVSKDTYELHYYPGGGTWVRKAVVLPTAKAGPATSKIKLRLLVCDADNCFPPKAIDLEATIKVSDSPAVEVEKRYRAEVERAVKK